MFIELSCIPCFVFALEVKWNVPEEKKKHTDGAQKIGEIPFFIQLSFTRIGFLQLLINIKKKTFIFIIVIENQNWLILP